MQYSLYGLTIRSEIALEAVPLAPTDQAADVTIRLGTVPVTLAGGWRYNPHNWASSRQVLLTIPTIARFLVTEGHEIIVDPAPSATPQSLAIFTAGSAISAVLHQRGIVALHASAVAGPKGAVIFMGPSGFGKSTMAAGLVTRHYRLLSEEISVLTPDPAGGWRVQPGAPRIKLWPDTIGALGLDQNALPPIRPGAAKRFLAPDLTDREPAPLAALCVLRLRHDPGIRATKLAVNDVMEALMFNTYMRRMQAAAGSQRDNFKRIAPIAASLPGFVIERGRAPFDPAATLDAVEALIAAL